MGLIYKIAPKSQWEAAVAKGTFSGAPVDLADGFIHFSTAAHVRETAARHFAGQEDLLLICLDDGPFGDAMKYEVSRGGALFPHLYGAFEPSHALWVKPLPLDADGVHIFPDGLA